MKRRLLHLLLTLSILVAMSSSLLTTGSAYQTYAKWNTRDITYSMPAGIGDYAYAWANAANAWTQYTVASYTQVAANTGHVYCSLTTVSGVDWAGITYPNYDILGYLKKTVNCNLNRYYTDNFSSQKRQSVAGHELGHALGLYETVSYALMYPYINVTYDQRGIYLPQPDDVQGIASIYL